jgi:hypothetical protein
MKKTILAITLSAVACAGAYAQGMVYFNNANTTRISTNSVVGGAATGQTVANTGTTSYYYALFFSTSATTVGGLTTAAIGTTGSYAFNDAGWTAATGCIGTNTSTTGRFASTIADASSSTSIANLAAGGSARFVVVGWSANVGSTLAQALAWYNDANHLGTTGWIGESVVSGSITTGISGSTPTATLFGTGAGFVNAFTLGQVQGTIVPEPGTMALAALGGASLLLFRRRK